MPATGNAVLTVGHSTHTGDVFINLLRRHCVTQIADVRAAPYSRFNPQFNRESLASSLRSCGIAYLFLGSELGGRSEDPANYDDGLVNYERLRETRAFQEGLDRVSENAPNHRLALMCAEKEPLECHRCLLVAPALEARGVAVAHVRPEGGPEPHADAMRRLLIMHGLEDSLESQRLFPRTRTERIAEAIDRQARRFAHRNQTRTHNSVPADRYHVDVQI